MHDCKTARDSSDSLWKACSKIGQIGVFYVEVKALQYDNFLEINQIQHKFHVLKQKKQLGNYRTPNKI